MNFRLSFAPFLRLKGSTMKVLHVLNFSLRRAREKRDDQKYPAALLALHADDPRKLLP
jgi:hypothetical protein